MADYDEEYTSNLVHGAVVEYEKSLVNRRLQYIIGIDNVSKVIAASITEQGYEIIETGDSPELYEIVYVHWNDKQKEKLLNLLDDIYERKLYSSEIITYFERDILA